MLCKAERRKVRPSDVSCQEYASDITIPTHTMHDDGGGQTFTRVKAFRRFDKVDYSAKLLTAKCDSLLVVVLVVGFQMNETKTAPSYHTFLTFIILVI